MRIREDDLPQVAFQLQLPLDPPYVSDLVFRVSMPAFYPSSDSAEVQITLDISFLNYTLHYTLHHHTCSLFFFHFVFSFFFFFLFQAICFFDRAYTLTPHQEKDLRAASTTFVETKIGQECILDLVQFAKDWVYDHTTPPSSPASSSSLSTSPVAKPAPVIVAKPIPVIVAPTPVVVPTPPVQQVSGIYTLPTPPPAAPSSVAAPVATAAAPKKPAPVSARKVKAAPKGKNTPAAPKVNKSSH